jgi:glycosyltransferase involved in cell wall biosynthesis
MSGKGGLDVIQTCVRFPPGPGGAETHVYEVARELARRGHGVRVFTSDLYKEYPFTKLDGSYDTMDGIPVRRHFAFSLPGDLHYIWMPGIVPALSGARCDVVHSHSYGYFQTNAAALRRKLGKRVFVLTPHYHPPWSMWGGDKRKAVRSVYDGLFARPVLAATDAIIGVSSHEMKILDDVIGLDTSKVKIIPNGIDFARFEPIPSPRPFTERYGPKMKGGPVVLYAGRLAGNKGLDVLVDSMPAVLKEHPDATFAMVGEDEGMKELLLSKAKKLGVRDNLLFTGHITDDRLFLSAFSACDVFVLPSEYEAFGIVLLEAAACEKPVIGSNVGGVPEAIGDEGAGVLVEYKDSKGLSRELNRLLDDGKLRKKMGRLGRRRVKRKFTWAKIVEDIEALYLELLERK